MSKKKKKKKEQKKKKRNKTKDWLKYHLRDILWHIVSTVDVYWQDNLEPHYPSQFIVWSQDIHEAHESKSGFKLGIFKDVQSWDKTFVSAEC